MFYFQCSVDLMWGQSSWGEFTDEGRVWFIHGRLDFLLLIDEENCTITNSLKWHTVTLHNVLLKRIWMYLIHCVSSESLIVMCRPLKGSCGADVWNTLRCRSDDHSFTSHHVSHIYIVPLKWATELLKVCCWILCEHPQVAKSGIAPAKREARTEWNCRVVTWMLIIRGRHSQF